MYRQASAMRMQAPGHLGHGEEQCQHAAGARARGHTKSVRKLGRRNEHKTRGSEGMACRASTECVGRNKGRVFPKQRRASEGPVHWGRPSSSKEGRNVSEGNSDSV